MSLSERERRWIGSALECFVREDGAGLSVRPSEVDWVGTVERIYRASSALGRLGVRAAAWIAGTAPYWLLRGTRSLQELSLDERSALVERLLKHPVYPVRGLSTLLKIAASFALFRVASVRASSGYDRPPARRALPVVAAPVREVA